MSGSPFVLFPWTQPFLPHLKTYLAQQTNEHPEKALLLFPSKRPIRYFYDLYRKDQYFGLLPQIVTIEDTMHAWLLANNCPLKPFASFLDAVDVLYYAIKRIQKEDPFLDQYFSQMDIQKFWPWGCRLYSLFEELYRNAITPKDITIESDISKDAEAIIQALGRIHTAYQEELESHNMTTMGYTLYRMACDLPNIPRNLLPCENRSIYLCGLSTMDEALQCLYKKLWNEGAIVLIHADQALCDPKSTSHHACESIKKIAKLWDTTIVCDCEDTNPKEPDVHFFAGYDTHSQLSALQRDLAKENDPTKTTALVIVNPDLLIPTLHHLPIKDVNIALGYPLKNTIFGQYIAIILQLHERKNSEGIYWRDLLHILKHPYIYRTLKSMLTTDPRDLLNTLQTKIVQNKRYQHISQILTYIDDTAQKECLNTILSLCVTEIAASKTLANLGASLTKIATYLLNLEDANWDESPLEREAIITFVNQIAPLLTQSLVSNEHFSLFAQGRILLQLLDQEEIPFEADPLTGVQVVGLFATDLLQFDQIFVLDVCDDIVPGIPAQDPLLPEDLRKATNLPSLAQRQNKPEYALFRLYTSSKKAYLYWQEGGTQSNASDGKKMRSRFIEQMIWNYEQKHNVLLTNQPPFEQAKVTLLSKTKKPKPMVKTMILADHLEKLFINGLSSTALDKFLTCPLSFARQYLLNLEAFEGINEGDAPDKVGTFIHNILDTLLTKYKNKTIDTNTVQEKELLNTINDALAKEDFGNLPAVSYYVLEASSTILLKRYFTNIPKTTIYALEKPFRTSFTVGKKSYSLYGRVDRIDKRDSDLLILDYKTGTPKLPEKTFWEDIAFFETLDTYQNQTLEQLKENFELLREKLPSVQLPFYLILCLKECQDTFKMIPTNAAIIELKKAGAEHPLFDEKCNLTNLERQTYCNTILAFIIRYLEQTQIFEPYEGDNCTYCPYAGLCAL